MKQSTEDKVVAVTIGASVGAIVGLGVWWFASKRLEQGFRDGSREMARQVGMGEDQLERRLTEGRAMLQAQIREQVPPIVRSTIDQRLTSYGITRETGAQLARLLEVADRTGLL